MVLQQTYTSDRQVIPRFLGTYTIPNRRKPTKSPIPWLISRRLLYVIRSHQRLIMVCHYLRHASECSYIIQAVAFVANAY